MEDQRDWLMLAIVAIITTIATLLKAISSGAALAPRDMLMRLIAKALWTGIGASGIWSAISEFRELAPAIAVAISAGVTMLGVDFIERALEQLAVRRLDVTPPAKQEVPDGPDTDVG
ncbi:hypothetical protein [Deinococcus radiophilus]|uniref:Holin n=1 Tax=Deinococcus radiophilus TaxID=32062 RepID=A0A431VQH4_9DEIO|nr:hypothetical protein [Deinococcus radiophilus]RTR25435.1 hypothetical protein EJ104_10700 [Deinococcus radiophilus]UFA50957.1 hypothetical protein LMT64_03395 [Deinococcus radiophilus]